MVESQFQSFNEIANPALGGARAEALRAELRRRGLDGFIVPRADAHQNEYVPASEERLRWLTGFSGSAGLAIVLADRAALFVDGRYILQAPEQVDGKVFEIRHVVDDPPGAWIENRLTRGKLGYDPWLHTPEAVERWRLAAAAAGGELVAVETNPIDSIWTDRPPPPLGAVRIQKIGYAVESARSKLKRVKAALKSDGLVVTDAHDVAWLFNIRGGDVAHTPLVLAYAFAPRIGKPKLYIDARKLSNRIRVALSALAEIGEERELLADLKDLGAKGARLALRCGDRRVAPDAGAEGRRRFAGGRRRPDRRDEGGEERRRARRRARCEPARQRGARALSRLVRSGSAERGFDRDRRRRGAGILSS